MSRQLLSTAQIVCAVSAFLVICNSGQAQTGFGVGGRGTLFRFDVTAPGPIPVHQIGFVSIFPEAIDFRPNSNTLYAIDVGQVTTQLYTININTAASTPVGAGFPSMGSGYDLRGNQRFGFDFNPKTLQGDGVTMFIRLVGSSGANLRLNSTTGQIVAVDTSLAFDGSPAAPSVDGAAYINNIADVPGGSTTSLYDMDPGTDALYLQNPPNGGVLNSVGPFGVTVDANPGIGFDVYTVPSDSDPSTVGDFGYAVYRRTGTANNAYLLYDVNLATGATTNGRVVGSATSPRDFGGGFAIAPLPIPEPATLGMLVMGALAVFGGRHRAR